MTPRLKPLLLNTHLQCKLCQMRPHTNTVSAQIPQNPRHTKMIPLIQNCIHFCISPLDLHVLSSKQSIQRSAHTKICILIQNCIEKCIKKNTRSEKENLLKEVISYRNTKIFKTF